VSEPDYDPAWTGQARTFLQALLKDRPSFNNLFTVVDVERIQHGTLLVTLDDGTTMRIDVDRYPTKDHDRKQARLEQGLRPRTNAPGVGNVLRKAGFARHGSLTFGGSGYTVSAVRGGGVELHWIDERGQPKRRAEQIPKIRAALEQRGYLVTGVAKTGGLIVG
jgi:hypothetical protein